MQEEVENRTVNLAISTTKLTFRTIVNGYNAWKRHHQAKVAQKTAQLPIGKQSIKELIGQNQGVSSIPIEKTDLKGFEQVARKYGVDYAITKDQNVMPPKYTVFFKAKDADALTYAFEEFTNRKLKAMDKVRYLNKKVEITSRMSSYEIPNKLRQLEATCDSKDCLDTAVATNMIAVGMDVDRLGLMVVTGQPKQNSEYIQATSRIGRAFPGLVFTLYNPYRPRDLSHYENFTGYHSQLYRFVEGTTATPFSARARDRVMHALIISAIRLKYPEMASNERAADIAALSDIQMSEIKALILDRLNIVKPEVRLDAENEIDQFIDWWKMLAAQGKPLRYYVYGTDKYNRLMNYYGQSCKDTEKATLSSMREVENAANMFYYTEE